MKKYLFIVYSIILSLTAYSQVTTVPALPTESDEVTVTFDATQGDKGLMGYTGNDVYAHTGVITDKSAGQWAYVISPWNVDIPKAKLTSLGGDKWQIKLSPNVRAFYGVPAGEKILKLAFVFRNTGSTKTGRATNGADIFYTIYEAGLTVSIAQPQKGAIFTSGTSVPVTVNVSSANKLRIFLDNNKIDSTAGTNYTNFLAGLSAGNHTLIAVALSSTGTTASDTSKFLISQPPTVAALPAGMRPGINYTSDNSACLVLYAPGKLNTYVIGDFTNWVTDANYQMNITPDGKSFWINVANLTKGVEYGFQYLVDGTILIPDPYTEKVLDPWNDQYIPAATYPNLKPYPFNKTTGLVSIIQTGQTPYNWQVTNFTPPAQAKMVVYELLVRDFTDTHNFQGVQSKLDYLQHLGINTIELMPICEFDGNISWGYNPALYFAPDKYYGPKNDLKALIDECHRRGLAVIMDMVLNHSYNNSPFAQLYWDVVNNRPAANNPWYNVTSPNTAYSYGNDFNHESPDTKALVDSVNAFWMQYYHVDGYRFDFTKGFTNTPGDGSAYDASRIAILERMGTQIWKRNPKAYAILEHFAANTEETELSAFGFMLWGNINYNYAEGAMGYTDSNNSDLTWGSYLARGWSSPHLMSYMESHDEERQMYKAETYGNAFGSYNTKVDSIALKRGALCASFFFTIPGPKMIWQFGELGYDYSINYCPSTGLVDATGLCRTDPKPLRWDYYTDPQRLKLFNIYSQLIRLKQNYPVFSTTDYTTDLTGVTKSIVLRSQGLNAVVVGNFGVTGTIASVIFPSTGTYYDYFSTSSINVSTINQTFNLNPGEYHIYTNALISGLGNNPTSPANALDVKIYPNPLSNDGTLEITSTTAGGTAVDIYTMTGQKISSTIIQLLPNTKFTLYLNQPGFNTSHPGIYLLKVIQGSKTVSQKLIIS
jgi:glycosidase